MCSVLLVASLGWPGGTSSSYGIQTETHEEKATNLKKQATGGLFQRWTFDQDHIHGLPDGFEQGISVDGLPATWAVQASTNAPSVPNVVAGSSICAQGCYQVLMAKELEYEYPDLSVRFYAPDGAGAGGLVLGARDAKNFYAAVVDPVLRKAQLIRISDGRGTLLAEASVNLKQVDWHSLRVQRNTIISKDFIEVYVDGTLVLSVEDQTLALGQIGLVLAGKSAMFFDSLHAVPLFSHRPLSSPPAY
ncbi:MAG: hypothetical protein Nkreftii_001155 [Candidatus Nitrospira kreftii]|uniref:3-keto-disaccharide hydrolase domain-containing protein n=1 Tax=Candidatus Nitrospira kreftii TaxID=2652173 RepID=A0A7S8FCX1_9BACT|nr:MAG: hypothetical protein Nkreftii_001155 [Candidatus Nitrospira kreftii]